MVDMVLTNDRRPWVWAVVQDFKTPSRTWTGCWVRGVQHHAMDRLPIRVLKWHRSAWLQLFGKDTQGHSPKDPQSTGEIGPLGAPTQDNIELLSKPVVQTWSLCKILTDELTTRGRSHGIVRTVNHSLELVILKHDLVVHVRGGGF